MNTKAQAPRHIAALSYTIGGDGSVSLEQELGGTRHYVTLDRAHVREIAADLGLNGVPSPIVGRLAYITDLVDQLHDELLADNRQPEPFTAPQFEPCGVILNLLEQVLDELGLSPVKKKPAAAQSENPVGSAGQPIDNPVGSGELFEAAAGKAGSS